MKSTTVNSLTKQQRALIAAAYDPQTVRQAGEQLVDLLSKHLSVVQESSGPVLNWHEPSENSALAHAQLQTNETKLPADTHQLLARFRQLVQQTLDRGHNLHHPHYVGHQVPASLPLAGLFDAVTSITNQVMAIYEMGPWATAVERAIVQKIGEAIGFSSNTFAGIVTSGGSLANLTALLTARNVTLGESWAKGVTTSTPQTSKTASSPVLVAHAEAHYCVTRSAGILGMGTDNVVSIPLDEHRRMDVYQLEKTLVKLRQKNVPIIAVSAAACATPTGAFDPLVDIADVCRRHEVWLHVDAAHGGAACLSAKHQHLVQGLHLADSVVCDAHKMMFMPALCALVFYRNPKHRYAAFQQTAPYLFDPSAPGMAAYDNGISNLECTKRASAMGLWGTWSLFGKKLFEALVDTTFDLSQQFYHLLAEQEDFEPYCQPECNIVVFRHMPLHMRNQPQEKIDQFQLQLRRAVIQSGDFYLVQTSLDGRSYLRTTLINPLTTIEHLQSLLDCLRTQGKQLA